jgi:hypothetical protein
MQRPACALGTPGPALTPHAPLAPSPHPPLTPLRSPRPQPLSQWHQQYHHGASTPAPPTTRVVVYMGGGARRLGGLRASRGRQRRMQCRPPLAHWPPSLRAPRPSPPSDVPGCWSAAAVADCAPPWISVHSLPVGRRTWPRPSPRPRPSGARTRTIRRPLLAWPPGGRHRCLGRACRAGGRRGAARGFTDSRTATAAVT